MILDIDVGNTRIKWSLSNRGENIEEGALLHDELKNLSLDNHPGRIRIASVNGEISRQIDQFCKSRWNIAPEFAQVVNGVAGISCGYVSPEKLGIDRWLCIVAARQLCGGSYLVVSAGTALTLDFVDVDNRHLGGLIVPGISLMRQSLWDNTWGVKVSQGHLPKPVPGKYTAAAVVNGALLASVGVIEAVVSRWSPETVIVTGGDAELLAEFLDCPVSVVLQPSLVLQGLSVAMP